MRQPTIYEVLREKLGREPTHGELVADVKRILFGPTERCVHDWFTKGCSDCERAYSMRR